MKETMMQAFNLIMRERIDKVAYYKLLESPEYVELHERLMNLEKKLIGSLQSELQQEMLEELQDLTNERENMVVQSAYKQGLQDKVELTRELKKIGIEIEIPGES